jgi:hypothetical protein
MRLPIASKAIAPMLWLLASESKDGVFDGSLDELVFRLHISEKEYKDGVKPLIDNDFFSVVSGVLAERLQTAIPETETETKTEREKKATVVVVFPDWLPKETWDAFIQMRKRIGKPPTDYAIKLIIAKLERFRANGQDVKQVLEKSITSGWQDVFEIKGNIADIVRLTVPASNEPDPALEKIKQDEKVTRPPTPEERAILNAYRRKA